MTNPMNLQAELNARIGQAWREMRRGASAAPLKEIFYAHGADEPLDLTLADALSLLCSQGPMRIGQLADALRISAASTSRVVGCLVHTGYASRACLPDDKRSAVVAATPEGVARFHVVSTNTERGLRQILAEFSPEEYELLADMLERFAQSIDRFVSRECE